MAYFISIQNSYNTCIASGPYSKDCPVRMVAILPKLQREDLVVANQTKGRAASGLITLANVAY